LGLAGVAGLLGEVIVFVGVKDQGTPRNLGRVKAFRRPGN
jgi:hypothetical protein